MADASKEDLSSPLFRDQEPQQDTPYLNQPTEDLEQQQDMQYLNTPTETLLLMGNMGEGNMIATIDREMRQRSSRRIDGSNWN